VVIGVIVVTVVQFALAIVLAAVACFLGVWLYQRATRGLDEWAALQKGNTAVGIALAAVVVGLAIILRPAIGVGTVALEGRLSPDVSTTLLPALLLLLMLTRTILGLVLGIAAILFAIWLFTRLTRDLDEMAELGAGNLAVAALLSGVILASAILVSPVVSSVSNTLLDLFVP
jgi:uncharacterized membrane protein YjfL (UPF0719 family)